MLHAVRIKDGRAVYCNRYVETNRLQQVGTVARLPRVWHAFALTRLLLPSHSLFLAQFSKCIADVTVRALGPTCSCSCSKFKLAVIITVQSLPDPADPAARGLVLHRL